MNICLHKPLYDYVPSYFLIPISKHNLDVFGLNLSSIQRCLQIKLIVYLMLLSSVCYNQLYEAGFSLI